MLRPKPPKASLPTTLKEILSRQYSLHYFRERQQCVFSKIETIARKYETLSKSREFPIRRLLTNKKCLLCLRENKVVVSTVFVSLPIEIRFLSNYYFVYRKSWKKIICSRFLSRNVSPQMLEEDLALCAVHWFPYECYEQFRQVPALANSWFFQYSKPSTQFMKKGIYFSL